MPYLFRLPPDLMAKLAAIRDQTGLPMAQQVVQAVREWTETYLNDFVPDEKQVLDKKFPLSQPCRKAKEVNANAKHD